MVSEFSDRKYWKGSVRRGQRRATYRWMYRIRNIGGRRGR